MPKIERESTGLAGDLLLLADTEHDELGRLHRCEPDFDDELAFVDRLRRVGLRVALDVERLVFGRAEQRTRGPQAAQETGQRPGDALPEGDVVRLEDGVLRALH